MFEVIDKQGRILGLCCLKLLERHRLERHRHGDTVRITLERPLPEIIGPEDMSATGDLAFECVDLKLWEVARFVNRSGPLNSRWYLMATNELPDHVWKAPNFIRLVWDRA